MHNAKWSLPLCSPRRCVQTERPQVPHRLIKVKRREKLPNACKQPKCNAKRLVRTFCKLFGLSWVLSMILIATCEKAQRSEPWSWYSARLPQSSSNTDLFRRRQVSGELHFGEVALPNGLEQLVLADIDIVHASTPWPAGARGSTTAPRLPHTNTHAPRRHQVSWNLQTGEMDTHRKTLRTCRRDPCSFAPSVVAAECYRQRNKRMTFHLSGLPASFFFPRHTPTRNRGYSSVPEESRPWLSLALVHTELEQHAQGQGKSKRFTGSPADSLHSRLGLLNASLPAHVARQASMCLCTAAPILQAAISRYHITRKRNGRNSGGSHLRWADFR